MPPKRTARTARVAITTAVTVAAATPMTIAAIEQLVADIVSRHLLTMTLFETARMVMAMEATILGTKGVVVLSQWFERIESVFHISNCAPENQVKFATCTFIGNALTWWNSHKKAVTQEVAYAMDWKALKKLMTVKYCPRGEIKKLEIKLWNLKVKGTDIPSYTLRFQELALMCGRMFPEESDEVEKYVSGLPDMIQGNVMSYRPQTMEEVIEFANDQMNQKLITISERQAEQKRKIEFNAGNNQGYQQQNKRQNTGRAYTAGTGEKREYTGSLPLCTKCNYHHKGPCAPRCNKCKRIGHLARDCRSSGPNNNNNNRGNSGETQNDVTCYECGVQGHFKRDCPKLKNGNRGNQRGNDNAPAKVYVVGNARTNPDSNIVTGMFLLNVCYASILFDTGADRSFVSTTFSSLIDITPTTLDHYYDVELADGKIIGINTIIRGCTLNFLNHPFNINLLPVELGSFDVIIGMDWLSKYHAVIDCAKKIVRIPWGNETLIVHGDGRNQGNRTRLNIISCTKTHKYLLKGHHVFLANITSKETKNRSGEKRLEDVPIVREFPEVFPEELPVRAPYRLAPSEMKEFVLFDDRLEWVFIIRVHEQDIPKTAFRLSMGHSIPSDMPFGLTNAPANKKEHEEHLKAILELLKKELYAKFSKYLAKIESIKDWASPKTPTEIRQFLVLAGYYRRFIEGFSKIAKPMTKLTQKKVNFELRSHKDWGGIECKNEKVIAYASRPKLLSDYDCEIRYHPGKANVVADALSRKERRVVRFGKQGNLNARYVVPFKVLEKIRSVAYKLELPQELSRVHNTFHVSNLKKCYSDEPLAVPLEGLHIDDKLQFVEEPVEIMEREIKRLKRSRIPLVKVRWNSRRGPEFTWEREDSFKKKYPHLLSLEDKAHLTGGDYNTRVFQVIFRFPLIHLSFLSMGLRNYVCH
ncbi:putative reverse transcriptase domain-containing protein [Tanacetum coccineum]